MPSPQPNASVVSGVNAPRATVGPTASTDSFWAAPGVMSQQGYLQSLGNWANPGGLRDFLRDWATSPVKHGILNPDGSAATYEQVIADLRDNRGIDVSGLPTGAYAGPSIADMSSLSPQEIANFAAQRSGARTTYDTMLAQLQFQQNQADQNNADAVRQYTNQTNQQRGILPESFVGRGVYGSGIWNQGLQDFTNARQEGANNMQSAYQQLLNQISQQRGSAAAQMNTSLANIDAAEAARKAALVSDLKRMGLVSA